MKVTYSLILEKLQTSFWVLPGIVAIAIVGLLAWLQGIEVQSGRSVWSSLLLYDASPQGARLILGSIATAVMTVVGVLFSITIVVLQQVSSQYTPRIIQNFIRSTPSQLVLGFFLGTFTYCLLLLRQIHDEDASVAVKVPQLAMSFGIILAVICLCLLILYVHHITRSIQSTQIIANVTQKTLTSLRNIVSDRESYSALNAPESLDLPVETVITARKRGYLQAIEWKRIDRLLRDSSWHVEALRQPGQFVQEGMALLRIRTRARWDERRSGSILRQLQIGSARTQAQDPEFGVRQLVDIGLRALSPGINDPSTAMEAINGITAVLIFYCEVFPVPHTLRLGPGRVIQLHGLDAEHFVGLSFDQLIQFGNSHLPVLSLIRDSLALAEPRTSDRVLLSVLAMRKAATDTLIARLADGHPWMGREAA